MNKPLSVNPEAFEELRHLHAFHTRYVGKFTARLEQLNNVPGFPLPKRQRSIANAELRLAIHSAAVRALDLLFDVPRFELKVVTGGGCCSLNCPNETPDGGLFCSACKALADSADDVEAHLQRQLDIERIRANALQERLNAADERVDSLTSGDRVNVPRHVEADRIADIHLEWDGRAASLWPLLLERVGEAK